MMIVVAPTVTEEGLPAVVERVSNLIEAQDGEVESFTHDSPWGHRRLAYPIQNFRDAFYVLYYFNAPPRAIIELDRDLRLDTVIIRHLIVKFDPLAHREYDADTDDEDEDEAEELSAADAQESEPEADEATTADEDTGDSDEADEEDTDTEDGDVGDEEDDTDDESDDEPEEADDDSDADETEEADDGEENEEE